MVDRFVEVQMAVKSSSFDTTIQGVLSSSDVDPDTQGILLLDEMQRFRTVAQNGDDISSSHYDDVWMLLSDGKFASSAAAKKTLLDMVFDDVYYKQQEEEEEEEEEDFDETVSDKVLDKIFGEPGLAAASEAPPPLRRKKKKSVVHKYKRSMWSARYLKRLLKLPEDAVEIMQWSETKKQEAVNKALSAQITYEGESYAQLLIFVSGNLDEAYSMSDATSEVDIDADVLHEFSKQINFLSIKRVLLQRFKPEQIARLGNVHMVYPALNRAAYTEIINRKTQDVVDRLEGVEIIVDQTVKDCIYRNGVFPAQGVRPVLSTVNSLLGNSIPQFVGVAAELGVNKIALSCEDEELIAQIGDKIERCVIECSVDKIRSEFNDDQIALASVHEAGHAIVYGLLLNLSPVQVVSGATSENSDGWIGTHTIRHTKSRLRDMGCVLMGGLVAEEWVYGEMRSSGSSDDLAKATSLVASGIRTLGMYQDLSYKVNQYGNNSDLSAFIDDDNADIERLLQEQRKETRIILKEHRNFFLDLVAHLIEKREISAEGFQNMALRHGVEVEVVAPKMVIYCSYAKELKRFTNEVA